MTIRYWIIPFQFMEIKTNFFFFFKPIKLNILFHYIKPTSIFSGDLSSSFKNQKWPKNDGIQYSTFYPRIYFLLSYVMFMRVRTPTHIYNPLFYILGKIAVLLLVPYNKYSGTSIAQYIVIGPKYQSHQYLSLVWYGPELLLV